MDSDDEVAAAAIIIALCSKTNGKEKTRKRRKDWVKSWLQRRESRGFYSQLLSELRLEECEIYKNYFRMGPDSANKHSKDISPSRIPILINSSVFSTFKGELTSENIF